MNQTLTNGKYLGLAAAKISAPVRAGQYAVHPVPLADLKAMRKQTPKLGNHHIVLVLKNGLTLPPFYFSGGGVRALFSSLKQVGVPCITPGTESETDGQGSKA